MIKRLVLLMMCGVFVLQVVAQDDIEPIIGVTLHTDSVSDGYVLFSPIPSNVAYLIDNNGAVVHQWQSDYRILVVELLENGDLLAGVYHDDNNFPAGTTGRIERYNWDNDLIWSYDFNLPNAQIHHDIALMPNGHLLLSMWEVVEADRFAEYGLNPEVMPEDGLPVYFDNLIEIDPTSNEIVWQWRLLDHSVQDYDDSLPNYGIPAENPHLIDINYNDRPRHVPDRSHINAIEYHPELDQIMVSAHYQSEIWIIDYSTGELVYRWGNPAVYGRGLAEERQLFAQHNPIWLENGNIQIFNNGTTDLRPYSTVIEISPPLNDDGTYELLVGAAYAPLDVMWEYRADPAETFFAMNTSGAQRLANGNIFITEGPIGRLFEIDADGNLVWEYLTPIARFAESFIPTPIFRATRYPVDYLAFAERELVAGDPIPLTYMPNPAE